MTSPTVNEYMPVVSS